jgi:hypothetical protein
VESDDDVGAHDRSGRQWRPSAVHALQCSATLWLDDERVLNRRSG